tara:strand:+ start:157 stop:318 length:162 start_codon:yes stop_codon:yes gene_type:complete
MNKLNFFFSEYFASYKKLVNQIDHKKLTLFLDLIKKKRKKTKFLFLEMVLVHQ